MPRRRGKPKGARLAAALAASGGRPLKGLLGSNDLTGHLLKSQGRPKPHRLQDVEGKAGFSSAKKRALGYRIHPQLVDKVKSGQLTADQANQVSRQRSTLRQTFGPNWRDRVYRGMGYTKGVLGKNAQQVQTEKQTYGQPLMTGQIRPGMTTPDITQGKTAAMNLQQAAARRQRALQIARRRRRAM